MAVRKHRTPHRIHLPAFGGSEHPPVTLGGNGPVQTGRLITGSTREEFFWNAPFRASFVSGNFGHLIRILLSPRSTPRIRTRGRERPPISPHGPFGQGPFQAGRLMIGPVAGRGERGMSTASSFFMCFFGPTSERLVGPVKDPVF